MLLNNRDFRSQGAAPPTHNGDYKKVREVLERVKVPHLTYTPKEEEVQTFLLKDLDAEKEPEEVLKIFRETGTEVKFLWVISPQTGGSDLIGIWSNDQRIYFER